MNKDLRVLLEKIAKQLPVVVDPNATINDACVTITLTWDERMVIFREVGRPK